MRRIVTSNEEESKLDRNVYSRNKDQGQNGHNSYDTKNNHLKYYDEIASNNLREKMDFPTLKEIERITRDESCLDIFKSKVKEKSEDLPKILDDLPLKRVKRMTYKSKEIGHMRRTLGEYCLNNPFVYINKEKGEKFAKSIFEKRLKKRDKKEIGISIDDLYGKSKIFQKNNNTLANRANNQSWIKKYKTIANEKSEKKAAETNEKINRKNYNNNIKIHQRMNTTMNVNRNDNKNTNNIYFNIKSNENKNKSISNNKNIKISYSQGRRRNLKLYENPEKEKKSNILTNSKNKEIERREYKRNNDNREKEKDKGINRPSYNTNYINNNNRRIHQINSIKKENIQENQNQNMYLKYKVNTSNILNQRNKVVKNDDNKERKNKSFVLSHRNVSSNYDLSTNKTGIPEEGNNKNNALQKRSRGVSQIQLNAKKYEKKDQKDNVKVSYYSSTLKINNKL